MRWTRVLIVAMVMFAALPAGCSSSGDDTTTTEGGSTTIPTTTIPVDGITEEAVVEMCHTLSLLFNAGALPGSAAFSIELTDLTDATPEEKTLYGEVLVVAPGRACPEHIAYADEIAYWLGF
jgi:hypothetical protein